MKGATGPITLDPALVTQAVRAAGAGEPQLAAALASSTPLVVSVSDEQVPNLEHWADLWEAATRALAFFGLVLITYGMLRIEHRVWAVGRIGRWVMVVGAGTLVVFWLLPRVCCGRSGVGSASAERCSKRVITWSRSRSRSSRRVRSWSSGHTVGRPGTVSACSR